MIKNWFKTVHTKASEFIFALRIFTKIDHILIYKEIPNKFQSIETMQSIFCVNSGTKLKINIQNGWVENSQLFGN